MIEIARQVDPTGVLAWLNRYMGPYLSQDVSNYAKGRLRCWLDVEPDLRAPYASRPAAPCADETWAWLEAAIGERFDYCLITYSGPDAQGILPHRDAGYADYEAWGWHVSGECRFDYWNDRQSFGRGPSTGVLSHGPATHSVQLRPGDLVHFNCKNQHTATPGAHRWNLNFWRCKR